MINISDEFLQKELTKEQYKRYQEILKEHGFEEAVSILPDLRGAEEEPTEICTAVNMRIKELRIENGLTQTEIANILNVSQREYWRYEQSGYSINILNLAILAMFYNVSLDWISGYHITRKKFFDTKEDICINGYVLKEYKEAKSKGIKYQPHHSHND